MTFRGPPSIMNVLLLTLRIQHEMRMRYTLICGMSGLQYFYTVSHKGNDFRKIKLSTKKVCFDFLCKFRLKYFSL